MDGAGGARARECMHGRFLWRSWSWCYGQTMPVALKRTDSRGAAMAFSSRKSKRAHPDLNQGPADLQSAALATELCTQVLAEGLRRT